MAEKRTGRKVSRRPIQRFPHQNFFANLVNVFHTKHFVVHIVYVLKIFLRSSQRFVKCDEQLWIAAPYDRSASIFMELFAPQVRWAGILIRNSLPFIWKFFAPQGRSAGILIKKFTTFYVDFSAPQGYSVGILIRNILSFIWIFCPAGPLGENFDKKFTIFYLDFLPRRAARREFW